MAHYAENDENVRRFSGDPQRRNIDEIIEHIKAKYGCKQLKQLSKALDRWQLTLQKSIYLNGSDGDKDRLYHLRLLDVEKLLQHLDSCFLRLLDQCNDRRLEQLYSQYRHILHRIKKLEATTLHVNSTTMKQHLLDEFKDEQQKRLRAEREKDLLIEGTQQALFYKDRILKDLKNRIKELEEELARNKRNMQEVKVVQGYEDVLQQKERMLRDCQGENMRLEEKIAALARQLSQKDDNLQQCFRTVETLKKSLDDARTQLTAAENSSKHNATHMTDPDALDLHRANSYLKSPKGSTIQFQSQTSPAAKTKVLPPRSASRNHDDEGMSSQMKCGDMIRMLFVQAVSIEGLLSGNSQ